LGGKRRSINFVVVGAMHSTRPRGRPRRRVYLITMANINVFKAMVLPSDYKMIPH